MFDIGFSEILLIAVVALLVLGPERLPKAARFTGLWVRRARSQWDSVKTEFEREMAAEDLKRSIDNARAQAREIAGQLGSVEQELNAAPVAAVAASTDALPSSTAEPVTLAADVDADAVAEAEQVAVAGRSVSLEGPLPGATTPQGEEQRGG